MRSQTSLLFALVIMALMGLTVARQQGSHRPSWVRDVAQAEKRDTTPTTTLSSPSSTPTGTTANGSYCTKSVDCASGNCYRNQCADPFALGQTGCYKDVGCTTGKCTNGRCVAQDGAGLVGDRCNQSVQCATGNCSRSKCAEQKDAGESCYKAVNCLSENCVNNVCIENASVQNGQTCNRSQQCTDGNYCRHGSCSPMRNLNGHCYKDQGCLSGSCENKRCVSDE